MCDNIRVGQRIEHIYFYIYYWDSMNIDYPYPFFLSKNLNDFQEIVLQIKWFTLYS